MAGQGRKVFEANEVLTAADVNGYLMDQSVMRFADSTARDAAIGTATEGMIAYLDDTNEVLKYDGSSWIDISGDITGVTAGTALTGGGTSGNVTLDVDTSVVQPNVITTQGDLVIGDASGDPVRLPVGSADQVLTSDGTTVSFQDAAGGSSAWTQLDTGSMNTGAAIITISGLDGYKDYLIELDGFEKDASGDVFFNPQYGLSTNYSGIVIRARDDGNSGASATVEIASNQGANDAGDCVIYLEGFDGNSGQGTIFGISKHPIATSNHFQGRYDTANELNALKFNALSANFTAGTYTIWGR